jgi:hypothetical protein
MRQVTSWERLLEVELPSNLTPTVPRLYLLLQRPGLTSDRSDKNSLLTLISLCGHPHVTDMLIVVLKYAWKIFISSRMKVYWIRGSAMGLFTTIWWQTVKPCFFSKSECIDQTSRRRSTVNSTMDPAKLAKLQAQAASNRIGTSISATSGRVFCGCASLSDWSWLTANARSFRREGHSAAKDSAQIETLEHTRRQEASGCAEEAERAADHGRGGG